MEEEPLFSFSCPAQWTFLFLFWCWFLFLFLLDWIWTSWSYPSKRKKNEGTYRRELTQEHKGLTIHLIGTRSSTAHGQWWWWWRQWITMYISHNNYIIDVHTWLACSSNDTHSWSKKEKMLWWTEDNSPRQTCARGIIGMMCICNLKLTYGWTLSSVNEVWRMGSRG